MGQPAAQEVWGNFNRTEIEGKAQSAGEERAPGLSQRRSISTRRCMTEGWQGLA